MTPIEQIKSKIKRRRNILKPHGGQGMVVTKILREHYADLLSFIESLEKEESEFPIIKGWVARDECSGDESNLYIGMCRPRRIDNAAPGFGMWCDYGEFMALPSDMFPDLKWEDEPIEVEIQIRPL